MMEPDGSWALAWEREFIEFLQRHNTTTTQKTHFSNGLEKEEADLNTESRNQSLPPLFTVSFMAERSLQDAISEQSTADAPTVAFSYLLMFVYVAVALNLQLPSTCVQTPAVARAKGNRPVRTCPLSGSICRSFRIVLVALVVVCEVLLSVGASIGLFAALGWPASLIILDVEPFFVLAVGVGNIFIFARVYSFASTRCPSCSSISMANSRNSRYNQRKTTIGPAGHQLNGKNDDTTNGVHHHDDGEQQLLIANASNHRPSNNYVSAVQQPSLVGDGQQLLNASTSQNGTPHIGVHQSPNTGQQQQFVVPSNGRPSCTSPTNTSKGAGSCLCRRKSADDISLLLSDRVGRVCAETMPSMVLTGLAECLCFCFGALSPMPAVQMFSLYTAVAILFNFLLQASLFLSAFIWNEQKTLLLEDSDVIGLKLALEEGKLGEKRHQQQRQQQTGQNCCCNGPITDGEQLQHGNENKDRAPSVAGNTDVPLRRQQQSRTTKLPFGDRLFRDVFAETLLHPVVKPFVLLVFIVWFIVSASVINRIRPGLDQKMAVPEHNHVHAHFVNMDQFLAVGPPVYFVLRTTIDTTPDAVADTLSTAAAAAFFDYSDPALQSLVCTAGPDCAESSLGAQISLAARFFDRSYIAHPALNWLDDYLDWLHDPTGQCCGLLTPDPRPEPNASTSNNNMNSKSFTFCRRVSRRFQGPVTRVRPTAKSATNAAALRSLLQPVGMAVDAWTNNSAGTCVPCANAASVVTKSGRSGEEKAMFYELLGNFLTENPNADCVKAGHAAFGSAVRLVPVIASDTVPSTGSSSFPGMTGPASAEPTQKERVRPSRHVFASHFQTYHTVLRTSEDYIRAMESARLIARNISRDLNSGIRRRRARRWSPAAGAAFAGRMKRSTAVGLQNSPAYYYLLDSSAADRQPSVEVFAYSPFYVFYEQYNGIVQMAIVQAILALAAIFTVSTVLLGMDPWSAFIIVLTISLILINVVGCMFWLGIDFNAISVVNIVMSIGLSVEFCAHIVRAFALSPKPTRSERAMDSLSTVGFSVLTGITLTKVGGISVLALAQSQIFNVFYFRMYLSIVGCSAAHSLLLLPVLLSLFGPPLRRRPPYNIPESRNNNNRNNRNPTSRPSRTGSHSISAASAPANNRRPCSTADDGHGHLLVPPVTAPVTRTTTTSVSMVHPDGIVVAVDGGDVQGKTGDASVDNEQGHLYCAGQQMTASTCGVNVMTTFPHR